jgi:hypothetical protein
MRRAWSEDYDPSDYFDTFKKSIRTFVNEIDSVSPSIFRVMETAIESAIDEMSAEYTPPERVSSSAVSVSAKESDLAHIFRDVDGE